MQLRKAAFTGFRLQLYLKIFSVLLHQIGSVILAILLVPDDFAIVGLATVFIGLAAGLSDFGIGSALIQRQEMSDEVMATGATLRLILSLGLVAVLVTLAPTIASAYGRPELRDVIWALSLLVTLNFAGFVARTSQTKALRFKRVFIPEIIGSAAGSISSVALALGGWSYWSLAVGGLIGATTSTASLYVLSPWKPVWSLDRRIASELLRFGLPLAAGNVLLFVFSSIGVAFLGIFRFGDLGYYVVAYSWAISIPLGLHTTIDNVMFPVYSAMRADRERIRRAFLNTLKHLTRAVIPAEFFLGLSAPTVVVALVGGKWLPSITFLEILAMGGLLYVISLQFLSMAVSLGRPRESLVFQAIAAVSMAPMAIVLSGLYGGLGLATSFFLVSGILFIWSLFRSESLVGPIRRQIFESLLGPALAAFAFAVPVLTLQRILPLTYFSLILEVFVALVTYLVAMSIITKGRFVSETKEVISAFLNR